MFRVFYIFRNPTAKKRVSYPSIAKDLNRMHIILFTFTSQTIQDWMLALIVLMFIAIDVIILLVYDAYSATQGTLEAIRLRNRENIREEIGVRQNLT